MMRRPVSVTLAALTAVVALTSCTTTAPVAGQPSTTTPTAHASGHSEPAASDAAPILAAHGLDRLGVEELVSRLDQTQDDKGWDLHGSIRARELVLTSGDKEATMPVPPGRFYLSVAPYRTSTHECFNHHLTGCQGELVGQTVHVTVARSDGTTLVDDDMRTYANGFVGMWLPANIRATITVSVGGRTASREIGTGPSDPTCLTTLQLR